MNGEICSLCFAIVFVPAIILAGLNILDRLRMRRVRRDFQRLPAEVRSRILDRIDLKGREGSTCTILVAAESVAAEVAIRAVDSSHYGGTPYAEQGDTWPSLLPDGAKPASFLIQVRLDLPLPSPWPGRLLVLFARDDVDQTVRSYAAPGADRAITLAGGPVSQTEWILRAVRVPSEPPINSELESPGQGKGLLDYDPVVLLESVPELKEDLIPHTRRPADLLAAVIAPNHCGFGFELSDIVQLGGKPVWLQADLEGLDCEVCGVPMRFLFQFGDLNGGDLLGNSGVCYVFGCDLHPDNPRAIVQMC